MDYFNSIDYLEPKCPGCGTILKYGINTEFSESLNAMVCKNCGAKI